MSSRQPQQDEETSAHRPSSFRELMYRDRRLVSRRQMDRRIRDRAAERAEELEDSDDYVTYFPAMSRMFKGNPMAEWRAILLVAALVIGAFFFGRWVGQQDPADPQAATEIQLEA